MDEAALRFIAGLVICGLAILVIALYLRTWIDHEAKSRRTNQRLMREISRHTGDEDGTSEHTH